MRKTLTPNPSPSGRGEQPESRAADHHEAVYRARAAKVMVEIARQLRQDSTPPETIMWYALRNRRLSNLKFRRQHPIENTAYVVDFLCHEARLVVEIDGGIHREQIEQDAIRQQNIEAENYHVVRFTNEQVKDDLETVLTMIVEAADKIMSIQGED